MIWIAFANWITVAAGVLAAVLWLLSARVRTPKYVETTVQRAWIDFMDNHAAITAVSERGALHRDFDSCAGRGHFSGDESIGAGWTERHREFDRSGA